MTSEHPFTGATWIWPPACRHPHNTFAQFRRDVELERVPRKAPLYLTADQGYQLWVNGQYVGRGPARGFQASWAYDEYDVRPLLREGRNWISVLVYAGGISTFGYLTEWHAGLLLAANWGKVRIVSDDAWLCRVSPAYRSDTRRMSVQTNLQEQFDAGLDDGRWITAARPPRHWPKHPPGGRPVGCQPWYALEPRGIPHMTTNCLPYERAVGAAAGSCAEGYADTPDVVVPLKDEAERLQWTTDDLPATRRAGQWLTVTLPAAGRGNLRAIVLDMGQSAVGTLRVEASGAAGGETLDFHGSEIVTEAGAPVIPGEGGHPPSVSFAWRLGLARGTTRHEFYQIIGHRYLAVVARDTRKPLKVRLSLRETRYPLEVRGGFQCSDATLNGVHRISVRTQQVCMMDAYVDTPWREQAQWWGDARVQGGNTFHLADDARLLARGVRIIGRQSVPNGLTYGHAPTNCHGCVLPDFTMIWALTIWDHWWQTGSAELADEQWPRVLEAMDYFTGEGLGTNGLLRFDQRYWLFLDWTKIHKHGTPTLLNLWYVAMLDALRQLARLLGRDDDAAWLDEVRGRQTGLVDKYLWDADAGMYRDGLTPRGRPVRLHSIHNQTLAVMAGLREEAWPTMVRQRLLPYLRHEAVPGALPSSYWVGYVYGVMNRLGHGADVVRHIRRLYAPMIPFGGTREIWDGGTYSHAWAAHPIQHLAASLGGVRQTEAAWHRIVFEPVVDMPEVDATELVVPTPQGDIVSRWQRSDDGRVDVRLKLPRGVAADVSLGASVKASDVTGSRRWRLTL